MNYISIVFAAATLLQPTPNIDAKATFELLKGIGGEWQGQANDGRKIRVSFEVFAGGSVIMERSWFEAHPDDMMVTMFHLDKDKLILTHYCVAKNQPRMELSQRSADGKTLLFTFRDATNLKDRDTGHMDKASYTFVDKDTFTSKWTWYQKGKEQWMEEFTMKRTKAATKSASAGSGSCHVR